MWLKACVRCRGDLYLRESEDGKEIACMQCGFIASPTMAREFLHSRQRVQAPAGVRRAA